jgi:hypothetical protein
MPPTGLFVPDRRASAKHIHRRREKGSKRVDIVAAGLAGQASYTATNDAVDAITKTLRLEAARRCLSGGDPGPGPHRRQVRTDSRHQR